MYVHHREELFEDWKKMKGVTKKISPKETLFSFDSLHSISELSEVQ